MVYRYNVPTTMGLRCGRHNQNKEGIMPNKRMTPIRVQDMNWMEQDIRDKFANHRIGLEAERDVLINEKLDKAIPKYMKAIGIDKLSDKFKVAYEKRRDFELNMDTQLQILKAEEIEIAREIEDAINNHQQSVKGVGNRHVPEFYIMERYGDNRNPEIRRLNMHVNDMCRAEAQRAYEKSPQGVQLRTLSEAENACYQVLHSGYDVTDARAFIDKVFSDVGISSPIVGDITANLSWDSK